MMVLNFSHPFTSEQLDAIASLACEPELNVQDIPTQFDPQQPFATQVATLADACGLTPSDWQTTVILVNPPALSAGAVMLLAELHGRMGYFPPVVRLRPKSGAFTRYEVAEIVNLQELRNRARAHR